MSPTRTAPHAPRPALARLRAPLQEIGLNTIAFGIIIAIQQLLVFPGISRMTDAAGFSQVILLITLSTIVVNVIGTEASKVALIRSEAYRSKGLPWDAPRLVLLSTLVVGALLALVAVVMQVPWHLMVQYAAITVLGIVRSYATTPDKYDGKFGRVVRVHSIYAAGAVVGLLLIPWTGTAFTPFLLAEALSVIAVLVVRARHRVVAETLRRTEEFTATSRSFIGLATIALLVNAVTYLDRLTITPLIGATALAIYYSASALSSSLSLITNPMGNAMLARLGRMDTARQGQMFAQGLLLAAPLVLVCWAGSFVIALGGLLVLYPTHFEAAVPLLAPVSLAAAFSNAVALLSPLLQRFLRVRRLLWFYLPYTLVYLAAITLFSTLWGLTGFAWASALANGVLFGMYVVQIRLSSQHGRSPAGEPTPEAAPVPDPDPSSKRA